MKRNLISVIILALCLANFVLTAILVFTILPQTKKSNQLIDDITAAIKMDLQSGVGNGSNYPIDQQAEYKVQGGEKMTINFKDGHYGVFTITLMVNTASDQYEPMITNGGLAAKESIIVNTVYDIVSSKTLDEYNADQSAVMDEILVELQGTFGADFIISVNKTFLSQ